jgi:hypothetical protein
MDISSAITLAIACIGALLGVMNTWKMYDRDKVKLRVIPKMTLRPSPTSGNLLEGMCIEVINLSYFPVTIDELGFQLKGTESRMAVTVPRFMDGGNFPRTLESRTAFTAYIEYQDIPLDSIKLIKCAYASTQCGERFTGKSKALQEIVDRSSK